MRRTGRDDQAARQLRAYFAEGKVEYHLVRFALAMGSLEERRIKR